MIRNFIALSILCAPMLASAAAGAGADHHAPTEVPKVVLYQAINVICVLALLFIFARKKVVEFFGQRRSQYLEAAQRYEVARKEAESRAADIRTRLEKLEATARQSIQDARSEAQNLQAQIVTEAQAASQKLHEEAKRTAEVEVQKAVAVLRDEVLREATQAARHHMQQQMKEQDQRRLQQEFVDKIQVVQQ